LYHEASFGGTLLGELLELRSLNNHLESNKFGDDRMKNWQRFIEVIGTIIINFSLGN